MGSRPTLTPDERARIEADLRATHGTPEGSMRKVAARHDRSLTTIRGIVRDLELDSVAAARAHTKRAKIVGTETNEQLRARLSAKLAAKAEKIIDRLDEGSVVVATFEGAITEAKIKGKLARDLQAEAVALGILLDKHKMLEQWEHGERAADAVSQWLTAMTGGISGGVGGPDDDDLSATGG